MKICIEPNCPTPTSTTRCPTHTQQREQQRGTRQQRGYGTDHQRLRQQWEPIVKAGHATCWRCGKPIPPGARWHLGHDDHDRTQWRGPECVPCNTATAPRRPPP